MQFTELALKCQKYIDKGKIIDKIKLALVDREC